MRLYPVLILMAALALQGAEADQPFKVRGHAKVAVEGGGAMQEKPDVTMEVRIDDTVVLVTEAMRKVTDARNRKVIADGDWNIVTETLKDARREINRAKASYYKDNEPIMAMQHLQKAESLLAQTELWTTE